MSAVMQERAWWVSVGSLKLTLAIFVLFAVLVVAVYLVNRLDGWVLAVPFGLFALNLLAAITTNPAFRRQGGLLVFHLALLMLVILLAVSRLTYLRGQLEITEGEWFDGTLTGRDAGPLHPDTISAVRFRQLPFTIEYHPGRERGRTLSRVAWLDAGGRLQEGVIGDHHPLVIDGYRFYTTHNKGFAPLFRWQPADGGPARTGSVHLPSYPAHEYRQALAWTLPGTGHRLWTLLEMDEVVLDPARPSRFRLPRDYRLVLRADGQRHVLRPGDRVTLADGTLTFLGLRQWMGYTVFYDRTIPWLLAACVVAVLGMGWHYWRKCAARPWRAEEDDD